MESRDITPEMGRAPNIVLVGKLLLGRVGRHRDRALALSYLLDAAELPGTDWTNSRHASFRSMHIPFGRSPNLRCVMASRNYAHGSPTRYLWIEVALMDSEDDADALIQRSRTSFYRKPGVETLAEREITGYNLPGVVNAQLYERDTKRRTAGGTTRYVAGRVGDVFLTMQAGGSHGGWTWEETQGFAAAQAAKIKQLRDSEGAPIV